MKRFRDTENADCDPKMTGTGDGNTEWKEKDSECHYDGHHHAGGKENFGNDSYDCGSGHEASYGKDTVVDEDLYGNDDKEEELEAQHNAEQVVEEMAKLMCSEGMPFLGKGFQMFTSFACPSATLGVDSTTKARLRYFEEEKSKIKQVLNNMDRSIAISVSVLSGYKPCDSISSFLCLQAHFIDDDWKLTKRVLCFQEYFFTMGYNFIKAVVLKSLKDWNIEDKVSNLNWRVCKRDVDSVKARVMEKRRLPLGSSLFSVRCAADLFKSMAINTLYGFYRSNTFDQKWQPLTWSNSERMWHLTISKLKTDLDLHSKGELNLEPMPSAEEWEDLKVLHRLLESAYNVAKLLFETKYPTANKFLYNLLELKTILVKESTSPDSFTSSVAKKMLSKLEDYLKDMFLLLAVVAVLDPRCKMHYIEYISSKFDDVQSGPVLEAIYGLGAYYANLDDFQRKNNLLGQGTDKETSTEMWLHEYNQFVQTNNPPKKSDLDSYLEDPVLPWSDDFNTLEWWKSEAPKYPVVAKMAQDILAIPLSVATSYDAYYFNNPPANKHVIASRPELMSALMCCESWFPKKTS